MGETGTNSESGIMHGRSEAPMRPRFIEPGNQISLWRERAVLIPDTVQLATEPEIGAEDDPAIL